MTAQEADALDERIAGALPAGALYAVGGRVRDELRETIEGVRAPLVDLDYVAVGLTLEELLQRLGTVGRSELVGAQFAVVKCTLDGTTVDVALPRKERSTGVGHREFEIEQSGPEVSLEDDLARRDFRVNMIARAIPARTLVDPYGGEADIRAKRIDLLREEAFDEDPLRMLRAAQFAARFEYAVSERTMAAMRRAAPLVATVSPERIRDEILKMLTAKRPSVGFEVMREGGVLAIVLPELLSGVGVEQNEWHAFDVYRHTLATLDAAPAGDPTLRLAALFHDIAKPQTKQGPHFYRHEIIGADVAREALSRLRFPNDQTRTVVALVRGHMYSADPGMTDKTIRRFVLRVGEEHLDRLFALRAADIAGSGLPKRDDRNERFQELVAEVLASHPPFAVGDLQISGDEVVAMLVERGILSQNSHGGPEVGKVLRALLDLVVDDPSLNDPEKLRAEADRMIGSLDAPTV